MLPWHASRVHIVSVVGARPQFVKLAPIAAEMGRHPGVTHTIVHTGQHYDPNMSDVFFDDLSIPAPDMNLGIGSAPHGQQTGRMMEAIEQVLTDTRPDWTLVYGDTNSTLAGALAAVKLHVPVAHLEAGLRSFNRRMPEEHNRVLTDHAADLLLAPTDVAMSHLAAEGLQGRAVMVGDVMTDVCLQTARSASGRALPSEFPLGEPFLLATLHRPDNTDDDRRLRAIVSELRELPVAVVLVAHPRLKARADALGMALAGGNILVADPLPYPAMVSALRSSAGVVTDSGGLQKEAFLLGVPCTTVRSETEWTETLVGGWNHLVPDPSDLAEAVMRAIPTVARGHPYGEGHAAAAVLAALSERPGQA